MPVLIKKAPSSIKEDVMMAIYGHYLERHFLFDRTHVDFVRQLVCHLERTIYFPGSYILEKGDIDGCMYFIHRGEILPIEMMGKNEIPQKILTKGTTFPI